MSWPCSAVGATTPDGAGVAGSSNRRPMPSIPATTAAALRSEIQTAAVAPGVIAYVDGVPAGWTRVMPRSALPGVLANRALQRVLPDDLGAWWVTCFAIDRRSRAAAWLPLCWRPL